MKFSVLEEEKVIDICVTSSLPMPLLKLKDKHVHGICSYSCIKKI